MWDQDVPGCLAASLAAMPGWPTPQDPRDLSPEPASPGLLFFTVLHLPHRGCTKDIGHDALYWASLSCPTFATVTAHKTRVIDKRMRGRKIKWVIPGRHKLYWLKVCWLGSLRKYCLDWKWIIFIQSWPQCNVESTAALKNKYIPPLFFFKLQPVR